METVRRRPSSNRTEALKSLLNNACNFLWFGITIYLDVISVLVAREAMLLDKLLYYLSHREKSIGPRTEPYGAPVEIPSVTMSWAPVDNIVCFLSVR